jgi:gluconolactonase
VSVVAQTDAHEGPVYVAAEDALYFTSVPNGATAIKRVELATGAITVIVGDANGANGMTLGRDGRLLVCEQGSFETPARIAALDPASSECTTLVDSWHDRPLNSPNDVVQRSDGSVWFTDPSYGHLQGFRPPPAVGDHVYGYDPGSDAIVAVADGLDKPNGLAFSPDESVLYVADNGAPHHLKAFDVHDDQPTTTLKRVRRLAGERVVAEFEPEHPDGVVVDLEGRIYASCPAGVRVLAPSGERLDLIDLPGAVNFTFGGPDRNVLFITTDTAVHAAVLETRGA